MLSYKSFSTQYQYFFQPLLADTEYQYQKASIWNSLLEGDIFQSSQQQEERKHLPLICSDIREYEVGFLVNQGARGAYQDLLPGFPDNQEAGEGPCHHPWLTG